MKLSKSIFPLIIAIFILTCSILHADVVERIVAIVNDQPITDADIEITMQSVYAQYKELYSGRKLNVELERARKKVLEKLIHDELIYQEALAIGISVDRAEVNDYISKLKSQFMSQEDFEAALDARGIGIQSLKDRYKRQLMVKRLMSLKVKSEVTIMPSEVAAYYHKNKKEFVVPKSAEAYQILIKKSKEKNPAQAKKEARQVMELIKLGGSFGELAKRYSQGPNAKKGGYLGIVEERQMIKQIDEAIFSLKPGEISGIVETDLGFHIIKVKSINSEQTRPLADVGEQIEDILMGQKAKDIVDKWLEELKAKAFISIK